MNKLSSAGEVMEVEDGGEVGVAALLEEVEDRFEGIAVVGDV